MSAVRPPWCALAVLAGVALAPLAAAGEARALAAKAVAAAWPAARLTALPAPEGRCAAPLQSDAPTAPRGGITQVRVRCSASPGWTRYYSFRLSQPQRVAVLRQPLAAGAPLTAALVDWQLRDRFSLPADALTADLPRSDVASSDVPGADGLVPGVATPTAALTGVARRALAAGSVLTASALAAPRAVQRGQAVTLISRASGMEVRAPGEALADAALGARVKVRNSHSRRIVEGVVQGNGTVEVAS